MRKVVLALCLTATVDVATALADADAHPRRAVTSLTREAAPAQRRE